MVTKLAPLATNKGNSMEFIRKMPDDEIVNNIRSGRLLDETVKELYRDHFEPLSRHIVLNSGSSQDAEDIFQEVIVNFISLVERDKFRGESSIRTFLFSMNRHTWLNELKRRGRAQAREEKYEKGQVRVEQDVSTEMAGREEKKMIASLVASLGETCKKILTLFYYENLSMREIVDQTDYENEQVVRNKKYKCLKQLEQLLQDNPALKETLKSLLHE